MSGRNPRKLLRQLAAPFLAMSLSFAIIENSCNAASAADVCIASSPFARWPWSRITLDRQSMVQFSVIAVAFGIALLYWKR